MNYKIILTVVVLLFVFAGGRWRQISPSAQEVPPTGVKELTVIGEEYRFQPSSITLKKSERVKITFKNNGRTVHNLIIEELGIKTKTIGAAQADTIEFTAPVTGTFIFFCSVPGHRAAGMEGSLIVE